MANKMTPAQLRAQAKKLIEQAEAEEAKREQLIGRLVVSAMKKEFNGFDLDLFKVQVEELWQSGKIKTKVLRKPKNDRLAPERNIEVA